MIIDVISRFFNLKRGDKYEFKKSFLDDFIELEIIKNGKKISNEDFDEKQYEYILKSDIFELDYKNGTLKLPYENIYMLDENSIKFFQLPDFFFGTLKIENSKNFLNNAGVEFEIDFIDGESSYCRDKGNLIMREKDGKRFFLRENDYRLVKEILRYNSDLRRIAVSLEQYKMVDQIKKRQKEKNIIVSQNIEDIGDIALIDRMELDFEEKDAENMNVLPVIKDEENVAQNEVIKKFIEKFTTTGGLQKKYSVNVDGKNYELVISGEILDALQVLKENNSTVSKKDFLKQQGPIFQDERMESEYIEYNYGPRVKGLGYLKYRAAPVINNSDIEWFSEILPYIDTMEGEHIALTPGELPYLESKLEELEGNEEEILLEFETDDGKKKIFLNREQLKNEIEKLKNSFREISEFKKYEDIKAIAEEFEKSDKGYIEYKNMYVKNPHNPSLVKELLENAEEKNKKEDEVEEKKHLLLKDNIDVLEHIEEVEERKFKYEYEEPDSLRECYTLMPYQKKGVQIMQNLYMNDSVNGVLLSDDMGLGKTLQILTFLAWMKEKKGRLKAVLVMPTSLTTNWYNESANEKNQGEIQKFFKDGTFKVSVLRGRITPGEKAEIDKSEILILSYETLRINQIELGKIEWDIMVCDEAQKIKNPRTLMTTAVKGQNVKFKIACTATPIENTILDLWCLVDFSNPGLLGSLKDFKQRYFTSSSSEEVLKNINDELKLKLGDHFIRRTKDVLNTQGSEFPKKVVIYEHIPYSDEQVKVINRFNRLKMCGESVLPLIQGMIMACSHPQLVDKKDDVDEDIEILMEQSLKLGNVKEILDRVRIANEKAIIFTKYKKMQKILSIIIKEWYGFNPNIINGSASSDIRRRLLDEYRNSTGFNVIILSPEAAGVGINLVEANHVIHYTRHWNPAKEEQATDRAYRIGQKKDVFVYYPMVAQNEEYGKLTFTDLDEWIESSEFNFSVSSSPEEKLNKIIIRKKRLLRDFFLAAPIDTEESDFEDFKNDTQIEDTTIKMADIDILEWDFLDNLALLLLEKKYGGSGYLTEQGKELGIDGMLKSERGRYLAFHVNRSEKSGEKVYEDIKSSKKIYEQEMEIDISKIIVVDFRKNSNDTEGEGVEFIGANEIENLLDKYNVTVKMIEEKAAQ